MRSSFVRACGIVLLALAGCRNAPEVPSDSKPFEGVEITVAVVDEPGLVDLVAAQRGEWSESRGGSIRMVDTPVDPGSAADKADVLIFPGDRFGDLVDVGALQALEPVQRIPSTPGEPAGTAQADDVVRAYRDQVTKYGKDRLALPLGGSVLVLAYRKDLLERPEIVAAAEAVGVKLGPPETWEELDALLRFLHHRDPAIAGVAAPLGDDADGVGTAIFLARAASEGQHRDHFSFLDDAETMEPRLDAPPFVAALKSLAAWKELGPEGIATFDAAAARKAFREGRSAFLIDRAEAVADWVDPKASLSIGVAPLPGSTRVFEPARKIWEEGLSPPNRPTYLPRGGGWLVGVSKRAEGKIREAAIDFASDLASTETATRIVGRREFPMLPIRSALLGRGLPDPGRARGVDGRRWSDAVQKSLLAPNVIVGHRIPEARADLADLDAARIAVLGGESAEEALAKAAKSWSERTDRLGKERRRWHYRRSLNSLATPPVPPNAP